MSAVFLSPDYALADFRAPTVIHSDAQNEHYIAVLESLEKKADPTREELELAELLTLLITQYEEKHYKLRRATPLEVIAELMEANGLRQKDMVDVFSTESIASEVLNGKRQLTKEHIQRLSTKFSVSPEMFFNL